jgi:lipoate---protein ligase
LGTVETWRRLPFGRGATAPLLAGVEGLMSGLEAGQPVLRWYIMDQPSLILGSSQRLEDVDLHACELASVAVHRRRSGGTTVYADHQLLSLDVGLPTGHHLLHSNITEAYRWFGEVWQAALELVGIPSRVIPDEEARLQQAGRDMPSKQVCFGGVSPYEVMFGERKLVGLAQVRRRAGGVLQAGIYQRWQPELVATLLAGDPAVQAERRRQLTLHACGLDDTGIACSLEAIRLAWEQALATRMGVQLIDSEWTAGEQAALAAHQERYLTIPVATVVQ